MQANEFCHWLRGYFNLSEEKTLTRPQAKLVRSELTQVRYGSGAPNVHESFCLWLEGLFDAKDDPEDLSAQNVKKIIDRLTQSSVKTSPPAPSRDREEGGIVAMC
jgi:hypothetical protein